MIATNSNIEPSYAYTGDFWSRPAMIFDWFDIDPAICRIHTHLLIIIDICLRLVITGGILCSGLLWDQGLAAWCTSFGRFRAFGWPFRGEAWSCTRSISCNRARSTLGRLKDSRRNSWWGRTNWVSACIASLLCTSSWSRNHTSWWLRCWLYYQGQFPERPSLKPRSIFSSEQTGWIVAAWRTTEYEATREFYNRAIVFWM